MNARPALILAGEVPDRARMARAVARAESLVRHAHAATDLATAMLGTARREGFALEGDVSVAAVRGTALGTTQYSVYVRGDVHSGLTARAAADLIRKAVG